MGRNELSLTRRGLLMPGQPPLLLISAWRRGCQDLSAGMLLCAANTCAPAPARAPQPIPLTPSNICSALIAPRHRRPGPYSRR